MSKINPIHTCCKRCVFAEYESITQVSCAIKYLEKYKDMGTEILEAYDNDAEFYILNNKKCIGYREEKYFVKVGLIDSNIQDKINYVLDNNKLSYLMTINLAEYTSETFKELGLELSKISIKPKKIIFVRYSHLPKIFEYDVIINFLKDSNIDCEWRIQTMLDDTVEYSTILNNIINLNKSFRFVLSINKPGNSIGEIIDLGNRLVYNELKTFDIISNKSYSCYLFSSAVYRYNYITNNQNLLDNTSRYLYI